jgi:hypothetical protein
MVNNQEWRDHSVYSWTIETLQSFVGEEEGLKLEFKKASEFLSDGKFDKSKLNQEVAEAVSAFLNSAGGVLLLGVQTEPSQGGPRAEKLAPIGQWTSNRTLSAFSIRLSVSELHNLINLYVTPSP